MRHKDFYVVYTSVLHGCGTIFSPQRKCTVDSGIKLPEKFSKSFTMIIVLPPVHIGFL